MASISIEQPPAKRLKKSTVEALKQQPERRIIIGTFVLPAGVESGCGVLSNMLKYFDNRSLCNVKKTSLIKQFRKEYGSNDFERIRGESALLRCEGIRSINEIIQTRILQKKIRKCEEKFPGGTFWVCAFRLFSSLEDVQLLMNLRPYYNFASSNGNMTLKEMVNQEGTCGEYDNMTPLMAAAEYTDCDVVQYLIEQCGVDPNFTNSDGKNVLHYAAYHNGIVEIDMFQLLLNHVNIASINKMDNYGRTPINVAIQANCIYSDKFVSLLRSYGGIASYHIWGKDT